MPMITSNWVSIFIPIDVNPIRGRSVPILAVLSASQTFDRRNKTELLEWHVSGVLNIT